MTKVQKWGNSLGLRIPKALALQARVTQGSEVELTLEADGSLVVRPLAARHTLERLVAGVTGDNLHGEIDSGEAQGREDW